MAKIYIEKEKDDEIVSVLMEGTGIELKDILLSATLSIIKRIIKEDVPFDEAVDEYIKNLRQEAKSYEEHFLTAASSTANAGGSACGQRIAKSDVLSWIAWIFSRF